jgi:hypothetical protein
LPAILRAARLRWRSQRALGLVTVKAQRHLGHVIVTSLHAHLGRATMPSPSSHRKDAAAFSGACSAVNSQHFVSGFNPTKRTSLLPSAGASEKRQIPKRYGASNWRLNFLLHEAIQPRRYGFSLNSIKLVVRAALLSASVSVTVSPACAGPGPRQACTPRLPIQLNIDSFPKWSASR